MGRSSDAAASPRSSRPAVIIEGVGEIFQWSEWWLLVYQRCEHETMLPPTGHRLFEPADVERVVREFYVECVVCSHNKGLYRVLSPVGPQQAIHADKGPHRPSQWVRDMRLHHPPHAQGD
jgi:hypothetical protein